MILVDTSIWIDHLAKPDAQLAELIEGQLAFVHPYVIDEILLGSIKDRLVVAEQLELLPQLMPVRHSEVLRLIENHYLFGSGIGYVDAHLLASASVTKQCQLWTRDKRQLAAAETLGVAADLA